MNKPTYFDSWLCVQGTFCDEDVNECAEFAGSDWGCKNGATCVNKPGSYECLCADTFFGLHCSLRTNDCSSANSARLCGNGVCINQGGNGRGYTCICNEVSSCKHLTNQKCSLVLVLLIVKTHSFFVLRFTFLPVLNLCIKITTVREEN